MLGRGWPNIWVYDRYATNALSYHIYENYSHRPWNVYFVYTFHFLISPRYYSTSGSSMRISFSMNLNYYYHEFSGMGNSFHDRNHVLVHVHEFRTISHYFREWVGSSWTGLMISHQKLIVLLSNKKTWYQSRVCIKSTLSILLLQKHIRGMKCGGLFFYHVFFYYFLPTQLQL